LLNQLRRQSFLFRGNQRQEFGQLVESLLSELLLADAQTGIDARRDYRAFGSHDDTEGFVFIRIFTHLKDALGLVEREVGDIVERYCE